MIEKTRLYSIRTHLIDAMRNSRDLRKIPLDVPGRICIGEANTRMQVDGILYSELADPQAGLLGFARCRARGPDAMARRRGPAIEH